MFLNKKNQKIRQASAHPGGVWNGTLAFVLTRVLWLSMVLRTIILCALSAAYAVTTDEVAQLSARDTLTLLEEWNLSDQVFI